MGAKQSKLHKLKTSCMKDVRRISRNIKQGGWTNSCIAEEVAVNSEMFIGKWILDLAYGNDYIDFCSIELNRDQTCTIYSKSNRVTGMDLKVISGNGQWSIVKSGVKMILKTTTETFHLDSSGYSRIPSSSTKHEGPFSITGEEFRTVYIRQDGNK